MIGEVLIVDIPLEDPGGALCCVGIPANKVDCIDESTLPPGIAPARGSWAARVSEQAGKVQAIISFTSIVFPISINPKLL